MINVTKRRCPKCGVEQDYEYYLPTGLSSPFGMDGKCVLCISCCAQSLDPKNLETIDRLCQFLDIPFDANEWMDRITHNDTGKLGPLLRSYCEDMRRGSHDCKDWQTMNALWNKAMEYGTLVDQLTSIHADLLLMLRKKWGASSNLTLDDYMRMEEYERHTLSHYPFKDEARKDVVRKLAKLSVLSDKAITAGETKDAVSYLTAYNTLMKELGIGNEVADDSNTINTLGELVAYVEKKGFLLNYRINESRDIVDKTIDDMKQYTRRLFNDSSETIHEMYNQKALQAASGTEIDDDDLERLYANDGSDEIELEQTLNEEELEEMFRQVENEFR